ncbi:MAG: hypothetical protein CMO81_03440 [Waddliaceae bacterium]|nr:hypothetical protein [Waddliaceae bacterium]
MYIEIRQLTFLLRSFWKKYPALLYACAVLLGTYACLSFNLSLLFVEFLFLFPFLNSWQKLTTLLSIQALTAIYVFNAFQEPELEEEKVKGEAWVYPIKIREKPGRSKYNSLQASIRYFSPYSQKEKAYGHHFQATVLIGKTQKIPSLRKAYRIPGTLQKQGDTYLFYPSASRNWKSIPYTFSLASWRKICGDWVREKISSSTKNQYTQQFLYSLALADPGGDYLTYEFRRFGLQHILVVSGFHFALLALLLENFLSLFLPISIKRSLTLTLLTLYFLFLGSSASIERAWCMVCLAQISQIRSRPAYALNNLGIAMIFILFIRPQACLSIGFQFSFLATAAILLMHQPCEYLLRRIIPQRSFTYCVQIQVMDQIACLILQFLRNALALSIAVNCFTLPLVLFHFHRFSWTSLLYNLFFPLLVSFSLMLLFLALFTPLMGTYLHKINSLYTEKILNIVTHTPTNWDFALRINEISPIFVISYLSILTIFIVCLRESLEQHEKLLINWRYL